MGQIVWNIKRIKVRELLPAFYPRILFRNGTKILGKYCFLSQITDLSGLADDWESKALGTGQLTCKMTERRTTNPTPPPGPSLAQGLNPPLHAGSGERSEGISQKVLTHREQDM